MKYSLFGKTGMNVSAMTLGTWGMGGVGWDVYDEEVKVDALKAALEEGIPTGKYRKLMTFPPSDSRNRFYKHFQEPMFSKVMDLLAVMDQVSEENHQIPLSQIALRWCQDKPFVSTCIVGTQKRERVVENARSFDLEISLQDWERLEEAVDRLE